ncbi:MAG TPA: hypothetical protein H9757_10495 [Candidatus Mediterraneibacter faecigallinarum]|uniref:Polysaccharide lyase 8 N-terminal alpha-helical domain-containing protein n=1 Tax=Candidatus Mediterraneibacter faecigallinarum TaxID=2838669 RepID=A0A9D2NY48_9FIRM|nr:hypothetical protein [Candidatus Mediterraneibacter faecigallinarum]
MNTATADLTTTFTYLNNLAKAYVTPGTTLYQNEQVPEEICCRLWSSCATRFQTRDLSAI